MFCPIDQCDDSQEFEEALAHDVVFVGTGFRERVDLLESVDWTGIDLGLYGQWEDLPDDSPLHRYLCGGVVSNATAAELYRRAKIGLNLYRQLEGWGAPGARRVGGAESLNPRAYELAACGCFQISDERAEIAERFSGISTFQTAEQLGGLVREFLADDYTRQVCAQSSVRDVAGHTFADRATHLIDCLERFQQAEREQAPRVLRSVS